MSNKNKFYGTKDIAEELNVHIRIVQYWFEQGKLKGTKVGNRWIVTKAEFNKFKKVNGYE